MVDILIRNLPDDLVAEIDAKAKRVGLSRAEYLRRALERERRIEATPIRNDHLERFASLVADLDDPQVMSGAWE